MQVAVSGEPYDSDPLPLDTETMRELGYCTIDLPVERLQREEPPIPPDATGSLVSGGSAGNLTALACAP